MSSGLPRAMCHPMDNLERLMREFGESPMACIMAVMAEKQCPGLSLSTWIVLGAVTVLIATNIPAACRAIYNTAVGTAADHGKDARDLRNLAFSMVATLVIVFIAGMVEVITTIA